VSRRLPEREDAGARLAARAFRLTHLGALGKGRRLALDATLELSVFCLQTLNDGDQISNSLLKPHHQSQQLLPVQ
jgi:hypothetical protein